MVGTLIAWLIYALFLKIAIAVATDVARENNSFGRAFVTAALLSLGHALFAWLGSLFVWAWPIVWLLILKKSYEISWLRAILVWLALVVIGLLLFLLLLPAVGLVTVAGQGMAALIP